MPTRGFALPSLAALLASVAFVAAVAGSAPASQAATLEEAFEGLSAKSFKERAVGVEILAATGHPRAVPILAAMAKGQLFVRKADGVLVIGHKTGKVFALTHAVDGTVLGDAKRGPVPSIFGVECNCVARELHRPARPPQLELLACRQVIT